MAPNRDRVFSGQQIRFWWPANLNTRSISIARIFTIDFLVPCHKCNEPVVEKLRFMFIVKPFRLFQLNGLTYRPYDVEPVVKYCASNILQGRRSIRNRVDMQIGVFLFLMNIYLAISTRSDEFDRYTHNILYNDGPARSIRSVLMQLYVRAVFKVKYCNNNRKYLRAGKTDKTPRGVSWWPTSIVNAGRTSFLSLNKIHTCFQHEYCTCKMFTNFNRLQRTIRAARVVKLWYFYSKCVVVSTRISNKLIFSYQTSVIMEYRYHKIVVLWLHYYRRFCRTLWGGSPAGVIGDGQLAISDKQ